MIATMTLLAPTNSVATAEATVPQAYRTVSEMRAQSPFYIAHRGGSSDWPEMSMSAYDSSAAWGMGALEVSVARTKDGDFFGLHDRTLDRTSKTTESTDPTTLTWDELSATYTNKLNASSPAGEPYMPVAELFAKYASNHVIFVDTKYIGKASERRELVDLMLSYAPAAHWVLKGYYDDAALTRIARSEGIQSWGYYYARDMDRLGATSPNWDMLGLELGASNEQWNAATAIGKPVVAFLVSGPASLSDAIAKGATGMMVSGVPATLEVPRLMVKPVGVPTPTPTPTATAPPVPLAPPLAPPPQAQAVSGVPRMIKARKKVRLPTKSSAGITLKWKSKSKSVCKVKSGKIIAGKKRGTCKLVAKAPASDQWLRYTALHNIKTR